MKKVFILLVVVELFIITACGVNSKSYEGQWVRIKNDVERYRIEFKGGKFKSKFNGDEDYETGDYNVKEINNGYILSMRFDGEVEDVCFFYKDGKMCAMDNCNECEYYLEKTDK